MAGFLLVRNNPVSIDLQLQLLMFGNSGAFGNLDSYSPSSATPSFDNRYRSAFLESPSSRAAWLLLPLARRRASRIILSSHCSSVMPSGKNWSLDAELETPL